MSHLSRKVAVLATVALPALGGAAEMTVVSRTTVGTGAPTTATQYIGTDRIRTSDGENDVIVQVGTGALTVINHKKKEYYEVAREDMLAGMQKLEAQMSGPGAAMIEKMMGAKAGEEVAVQKGVTRKVAGYDCTNYTFTLGDNMKYETCMTQGLQLPAAYYEALRSPYAMMGPMGKRFGKVFDEMQKVKGFPIAMSSSVNLMGRNMSVSSEATDVRTGAIPATAWQVPAGYKKKDSPFRK